MYKRKRDDDFRPAEIAREICNLMARRSAQFDEAVAAMMTALVVTMLDEGVSKKRTLLMLSELWELLEPDIEGLLSIRDGRAQ